jgi:hypothetical protein
MYKVSSSSIRLAAITVFLGSVAVMGPLNAAPADEWRTSDSSQDVADQTASSSSMGKNQEHSAKMDNSPQAVAQRIEDRIKTLHDKLEIANSQEPKWNDVAQAMRDNEATINQLIQDRHQNPAAMTAIDDLQSYEKIAQAHLDGLHKLIPAFQALYNDMPDEQRKKADAVFSGFEGHSLATSTKSHH